MTDKWYSNPVVQNSLRRQAEADRITKQAKTNRCIEQLIEPVLIVVASMTLAAYLVIIFG